MSSVDQEARGSSCDGANEEEAIRSVDRGLEGGNLLDHPEHVSEGGGSRQRMQAKSKVKRKREAAGDDEIPDATAPAPKKKAVARKQPKTPVAPQGSSATSVCRDTEAQSTPKAEKKTPPRGKMKSSSKAPSARTSAEKGKRRSRGSPQPAEPVRNVHPRVQSQESEVRCRGK